jgi:hypothetical protein
LFSSITTMTCGACAGGRLGVGVGLAVGGAGLLTGPEEFVATVDEPGAAVPADPPGAPCPDGAVGDFPADADGVGVVDGPTAVGEAPSPPMALVPAIGGAVRATGASVWLTKRLVASTPLTSTATAAPPLRTPERLQVSA